VRAQSFGLLIRYSDKYFAFNDPHFVNTLLIPTAFEFLSDPRAMMAEASGLMLKLAFLKCISVVQLPDQPDLSGMNAHEKRLLFADYILTKIESRLDSFQSSLINEGKTSGLIHGLLAFFKQLFADF
jgi:hypothetical protein